LAKHFKGTPTEERALGAYVKLMRASETLHHHAMLSLQDEDEDLTPSQFAVLEAIYHVGPLNLSDLARKILKSGGNLTMVVRNLEKRGLALRERNEDDRRSFNVVITAKGRRMMAQIFPAHVRMIVGLLGRLTSREQEDLARLCRKLGKG
jgi:MarR family 2-MHQ and catechol resistance regulon transcriptional repressor